MRAWILAVCACQQTIPVLPDSTPAAPDAPECGPIFRLDSQVCTADGLAGVNLEGSWMAMGMETTTQMPVAQPLSFTLTISPPGDQVPDGICFGISGGPAPSGEWDADATSASRGVAVSATVATDWGICADNGGLVIAGSTRETGGQTLEMFTGTLTR